ncbi:MAG: aldolase/citrate lyase family protein [Candidatus Dormibacteraeota bacterium]|nr:aldolase/citrate lyase family protein [Candidatus Dormibacteraeota bacterium]
MASVNHDHVTVSSLRERWRAGDPTFGAWCTIPSTWTAELAARSGHDWVCIDTQHGLIGYELMLPMLQAISAGGAPSFVRVPWNEPGTIMKALDAGAGGVIVPMVNSVEEAKSAVGACRYSPDGFRSMGPIRARVVDGDWRLPICVVMIETVQAVERVDEILAVPGIDAVFVGPSDLAISAGVDSSYDGRDPEHRRLIETILRSCQAHGVTAGIMCGSPEVAIQWHTAGFQMLALGSDSTLLADASRQIIERTKALARLAG